MTWKNSNQRYGSFGIALHWLIFILIAAAYTFILLREIFPKGSDPRETMKALHFMLGLSVLVLVLPRIIVRLLGNTPAIVPSPAAWQQSVARIAHLALYLFMIVMPMLGWLMLSAADKPIPFFGLHLPALIGVDKELAKFIKEIHETLGEIGYFLIGFHALAALYHHFILRDSSLVNMLPKTWVNRLKSEG